MDDIRGGIAPAPLRVWSLATFHTVTFVAAVVIVLHVRGSLATALGRLDTALGVAAFLALWVLTWYATRAGVRKMDPTVEEASAATIVFSTAVAGGFNGLGILAIVPVLAIVSAMTNAGGAALKTLPYFVLFAVIGGVVAFTVGAVVGLAYGLVDAFLLRSGAALLRWTESDPP